MSVNTQDDVRAAFESVSKEPERDEVAPESSQPAADAKATGADEPNSDLATAPVSEGERVRGPDGKFAKKPEAAEAKPSETPAPVAPTTTQTPVPAPATQTAIKPPQSWKADVREKFAALPPEVQAEVMRREQEFQTTLQASSEPKKFHEAFKQTIAPYEQMIRAEGGEPLKAVASLLQTAAALRTAPPAHKAQLIAQMVQGYGVSVEDLAAALDGRQAQPGRAQNVDPAQIAAQVQERVMQQFQQAQAQRVQQSAVQEIEAFVASGEAEFLEDVREDMALILERGRAKTPKEAYDLATRMNPDVFKVIQQREAAKAAQAQTATVAKARAASTSVRSTPAVAPAAGDEAMTTEEVVRAAYAAQAGGGTR